MVTISTLYYVGTASEQPTDVERRLTAEGQLQGGMSRSYVSGRVAELTGALASKTYVDSQDGLYAQKSYYQTQDALLVPLASKGAPDGVASLSTSSPPKIPQAQVPVLGSGTVRGPFGMSASATVPTVTTGATPVKIADLFTGLTGVNGMLWVFMVVAVQSAGGRPMVEVRYGNNTQTTYGAQTLIAAAEGRDHFSGYQLLAVFPAPHTTGLGQSSLPYIASSTNLLVQAWMYDSGGGQTNIQSGYVYSSAVYLAKTAL